MKILFDHSSPFLLAHGGFQIQIEETKRALEELGVGVEFLRWWDETQQGDIIHFFGRPVGPYVDLARKKNIRVVMSELLTGLGSRSASAIALQRLVIRGVQKAFPYAFWAKMGWDSYTKADRVIALTPWESELMQRVFSAPAERLAVIPNGVDEEFLTKVNSASLRADYLVCVATITERKRIVETALSAVEAKTPLWIIGRPYSETDPYAQKFFALAKQHSEIIRHEGPIQDRHQLARAYRQARGFVLLSTQESLSLSALEAAACECPLLLSDLPWARTVFGNAADYCPLANVSFTARTLRQFYDSAPELRAPPKPASWKQVGQQLKTLYESLLSTSR
jgi:glycosyltransferase involved in cell wall biosynthesis